MAAKPETSALDLMALLWSHGSRLSVIVTLVTLIWQGSGWFSNFERRFDKMELLIASKAESKDVEQLRTDVAYRFDLLCARAPGAAKGWVCFEPIPTTRVPLDRAPPVPGGPRATKGWMQ